MKRTPDTLALAMDYAAAMEACAAYVLVSRPTIREPDAVYKVVRPIIDAATGGDKQESFMVLLLNTKNRLIMTPVEATRGLLDTSPVHPREVFREAVRNSAASVILAHNHPSGLAEPSHADQMLTTSLRQALAMVDVKLLDHFIVAGTARPLSFAERGLL